jgi:glutamine synthetase
MDSINTERRCPPNLSEAMDALKADTELSEAVGADLVANQLGIKAEEWRAYTEAEPDWAASDGVVSDWERATYLPFL